MSTTKDQFIRLVDWYRINKPSQKRITVDMTVEEMREHFKERDGKFYYNEFEVVKQ